MEQRLNRLLFILLPNIITSLPPTSSRRRISFQDMPEHGRKVQNRVQIIQTAALGERHQPILDHQLPAEGIV